MKDIIIAVGSKENLLEDIHDIAKQLVNDPEIAIASGKEKGDEKYYHREGFQSLYQ